MHSIAELREHLKGVTYKPGWLFRITEAHPEDSQDDRLVIQIYAYLIDATKQNTVTCVTLNRTLAPLTQSSYENFDAFLFDMIRELEDNEMREWFRINGKHYINPKSVPIEKESRVRFADYLL